MNFQNMPELKLAWDYQAALVIIALACTFTWWRFRRAKWLYLPTAPERPCPG